MKKIDKNPDASRIKANIYSKQTRFTLLTHISSAQFIQKNTL